MATDILTTSRLNVIAEKLKRLHGEFLSLAGRSLSVARESGDLLIEAKDELKHGEWESWLETYFPGSSRTAEAYMRIASRWDSIEAKAQTTADLTLDAALKLLAKPKAEPAPRVCRNCGGNEFDEDGDCASCREPKAPPDDDPPESPTLRQDASEEEEDAEGEEAEENAPRERTEDKEPFGEQLWLVLTRFWQNQYPEVPPITVADYLEEIRERVLKGEK
jgi:hypothetical protein